MAPSTPPTFYSHARHLARGRRPRNANPYDAAHRSGTPEVTHLSTPRPESSPPDPTFEDGDDDDGEDESHEMVDIEDEEEAEDEVEEEEDDEAINTTVDVPEDVEIEGADADGGNEEVPMEVENSFDSTGLKEIGNLASWTVSTSKPGCGVEELRDENTELFWQSDGPQPHHLNIHFTRFVSIVAIRIYLDFDADESYTPTRITLLAGTGYHDLIPFSSLEFSQPKGWINVPLEGVGGGSDGNTLRAFLVQIKVVENHQNGKDTHIRGLKIYAKDERMGSNNLGGLDELDTGLEKASRVRFPIERNGVLVEPGWMGEPELR